MTFFPFTFLKCPLLSWQQLLQKALCISEKTMNRWQVEEKCICSVQEWKEVVMLYGSYAKHCHRLIFWRVQQCVLPQWMLVLFCPPDLGSVWDWFDICTLSLTADCCSWGAESLCCGGGGMYTVYEVVDCSHSWLKISSQLLAAGLVIGHFVLYVSGKCLTSELYMIGVYKWGDSTSVKHRILRSRKAERTKQSH